MTRIGLMVRAPEPERGGGGDVGFRQRIQWRDMRGWSFPIGRFLGVDVRIHTFFLLLLGLAISYGASTGSTGGRGFGLWMLLLLAVVVREVARAIAAAWYGLELRSLLLLPFGGLMSYGSTEATERATTPEMQKRMAVIGPLANMGFGLLLAGDWC